MTAAEARKMATEVKKTRLFTEEAEAMKHLPTVINIIPRDIEKNREAKKIFGKL